MCAPFPINLGKMVLCFIIVAVLLDLGRWFLSVLFLGFDASVRKEGG